MEEWVRHTLSLKLKWRLNNNMGLRETIAIKRGELALMEADARIEDLSAEIEKVKAKKHETEEGLKKLKEEAL